MSANNVGAQIRHFVAICQAQADISGRSSHPLNKSSAEWQHLTELLTSLLRTCPPTRSAILSFLNQIITAHLRAISSPQQSQSVDGILPQKRRWQALPVSPAEPFILSVLSTALEVCKEEAEVIGNSGSSSFAAEVCAFALDLLSPIAPPPHRQLFSALKPRRLRKKSFTITLKDSRSKKYSKKAQSDIDSTAEDASELDDPADAALSSSSDNESDAGSSVVAEGMEESSSAPKVEAEDYEPDLRPVGFNIALLRDIWMKSEVVKELMRIAFTCLIGRKVASRACVERLIGFGLPHELRGSRDRYMLTGPHHPAGHPMDVTACRPHWIINWLLRQALDLELPSDVVSTFCRRLLDTCLRPPSPHSASLEHSRFWALTCLSHLAFVGAFFGGLVSQVVADWTRQHLVAANQAAVVSLTNVLGLMITFTPRVTDARLRQYEVAGWAHQATQPQVPVANAMTAAKGFLIHEFQVLPTSANEVVYLLDACCEIRSSVLKTLHDTIESLLETDPQLLEEVIGSIVRPLPKEEVEALKEVFVDGICLPSDSCGCEWIQLLLRLEATSGGFTLEMAQSLLRRICLRIHAAKAVKTEGAEEDSPQFLLGASILELVECEPPGYCVESGSWTLRGGLMRQFVEGGSYYAGLLIVLISAFNTDIHAVKTLFKNMILWNVRGASKCLLPFFFPLYAEWRLLNRDKDILTPCLHTVLNEIDVLDTDEQAQKALVNLLWLVKREKHRSSENDGFLRLLEPALSKMLSKLATVMFNRVGEPRLRAFDAALHLAEVLNCSTQFSVPDSIALGRRLVQILVALMRRLDKEGVQTPLLKAFNGAERLLDRLGQSNFLITQTALLHMAQSMCDQYAKANAATLIDPTDFPTSSANPERSSRLLIDNPPKASPLKVSVTSGQLTRRNPPPKIDNGGEDDCWKPSSSLWLHLLARHLGDKRQAVVSFGECLELVIMPHGLMIPQAHFQVSKPEAFQPRLQSSPVALERFLYLQRVFLPDGSRKTLGAAQRVLWGSLDLLLKPKGDEQSEQQLLPGLRILLGLLAGLEIAWNAPLAPRVPPTNFKADEDVQRVLGIFPVVGLPTIAKRRARKREIEYGMRRVGTDNSLYAMTEMLLSRLVQYAPGVLSKTEGATAIPLENLLRLLSPRETTYLLMDVRRWMRYHACMTWNRTNPQGLVFTLSANAVLGLLNAHLLEEGLSSLYGRLMSHLVGPPSSVSSTTQRLRALLNRRVEAMEIDDDVEEDGGGGGGGGGVEAEGISEIEVDGELVVLLDE